MGCKITFYLPNKLQKGMTLVEVMVAMAIGSLVFIVLASLTLFSARSFSAISNYTELNMESRRALDKISKEIRQSRGLNKRTPTKLEFNREGGGLVTYEYDPNLKLLTENLGAGAKPILKNCTVWTNEMFIRNPQAGNFDYTATTDPIDCKMVRISWTCTSDSKMQKNSADVQSMRVVIRKKPD